MKAIKTFKLIGSALIVVVSINAWSQTSESAATSTQSAWRLQAEKCEKPPDRRIAPLSKKVLSRALEGRLTLPNKLLAKGGAVVLVGSVHSPDPERQGGRGSEGVPGVTSMKNSLTLKKGSVILLDQVGPAPRLRMTPWKNRGACDMPSSR